MVSFRVRKHEQRIIAEIADRATAIAGRLGVEYPTTEAMMDITATHANGCPLKLEDLLQAEQFHFVHDVFGIRRHLNRETGHLEHCFVPRFAVQVNQ